MIIPAYVHSRKRIQKLLEKAHCEQPRVEHDSQQRQRHLLSKRTRVSASNAPKAECEKVSRSPEEAVCKEESEPTNQIQNDHKEVLLRMLNRASRQSELVCESLIIF